MFNFPTIDPSERELRQIFSAAEKSLADQEKKFNALLRQSDLSTVKLERRLRRIKGQILREGLLTPEQIAAIEQKAANSVRNI